MIPFTKMHGLGNDFVVLDAFADASLAARDDLPALARAMCHRRTGVGADGVVVLSQPPDTRGAPDADMRIINSDGSPGMACGNGLRCAARMLVEREYAHGPELRINTETGLRAVSVIHDEHTRFTAARVDMGEPVTDPHNLPVRFDTLGEPTAMLDDGVPEVRVEQWPAVFVGMGNPHLVSITSEPIETIELARVGPMLERHPAFPERMNVHFVSAQDRASARVRTWERGAGATLACGSGACAVLVACVLARIMDRDALIHMPGGALRVVWDEATNRVSQEGAAAEVFRGRWLE